MRYVSGTVATLAALTAGLFGGLWLTAGVLDAAHVPGAARAGVWTVWPRAGASDADPYTRALFARRGELVMHPAEGLTLYAMRDEAGEELDARCAYRMSGRMPSARFWTLAVYRPDGSLVANAAGAACVHVGGGRWRAGCRHQPVG